MDDPLLVGCFERLGNLLRYRNDIVDRKAGNTWATLAAFRNQIGQGGTLDQLHHERTDPVGLFEAMNDCDVRVIQ